MPLSQSLPRIQLLQIRCFAFFPQPPKRVVPSAPRELYNHSASTLGNTRLLFREALGKKCEWFGETSDNVQHI